MTPSTRPRRRRLATTSGVPPLPAIASTVADDLGRDARRRARATSLRARRRPHPCGPARAVGRSTPLIRVCAVNGTNVACSSSPCSRALQPVALACASTTIERPSGVSSARLRQLGRVGELARRRRPAPGSELGRLPVAERDRAGLVEQQRRHVAGRLDGAAGHRQHVALHEPVHAGDADGGEQRADRGRDQADQQRDEHDDALLARRSRPRAAAASATTSRKMIVSDGEQDVERDLVRRLLPARALDQRDHPVDERLARASR